MRDSDELSRFFYFIFAISSLFLSIASRINCTSSYSLGVHTEHRNKNTTTIVICHNAIHSQYGGCNAAMRKINKIPDTATHICLSVILFHKFICLSLHNHTIPQRYPTGQIPWRLYADRAGLYLDHLTRPPVRLGSPSVCLHRNADGHAWLNWQLCHSIASAAFFSKSRQ